MHNELFDLPETHTSAIAETFIQKTCPNCGTLFEVTTRPKRGPKQKYCQYRCGTDYHCQHVRDKDLQRQNVADYWGKNPEKRFMSSTKQSAKEWGLSFDLTDEWFKTRLDRGVCEVTGLPIKIKSYKQGDRGNRGFYSPSIDRIDNTVGYVPSNCRMVCWGYNLVKNKFTDRDVVALAVALIVQSLPDMAKVHLLELLPNTLLSSLPSGHGVF